MPKIKYNSGNNWVDLQNNLKATETTDGVSKIATSEMVSQGIDDYTYITPKKLREVVNTLPIENMVVHKAGNESITGLKTFRGTDNGVGVVALNSTSTGINDTVSDNPYFGKIDITDKNDISVGVLGFVRGIDDTKLYNSAKLEIASNNGVFTPIPLEIRFYDNGDIIAYAPTTKADAKDNEIATAGWVLTKLSEETSARTEAETQLQSQITSNTNSITNINASILGINGDISGINNSITNINGDITELNKDITDINTELGNKQATLTSEQLAAVNSGVTSSTLEQIASNTSNIATKADQLTTYTKDEVDGLIDNITIDETNIVHKSGNETIDGTKTFTSSPNVPTVSDLSDSSQSVASTAFVQNVVNNNKLTITYVE